MSTKAPPSLGRIMRDLRVAADEAGSAGPYARSHGAVLTMRSKETVNDAGIGVRRRQLIISRQGAPVGLAETATFLAYGQIPPYAVGVCYWPGRDGWWRVAYTWDVRLTPFALLPLPI